MSVFALFLPYTFLLVARPIPAEALLSIGIAILVLAVTERAALRRPPRV